MRFDEIQYPIAEQWLHIVGSRICYGVSPSEADQAAAYQFPMLLVPPLGRGLMHYRPNLTALSAIGPVVIYDPPGCGKSQKSGAALELVDLAGQTQVAISLIELCRARGDLPAAPVVIVGTSFGAVVALSIQRTRPDLVRALVLSDAAGARAGIGARLWMSMMTSEFWMKRIGRAGWQRGLSRMFAKADHPALAANLEIAMKLREGEDWPSYLRALALTARAARSADVPMLLNSSEARRAPIQIIWGSHDRVTPLSWGRELSKRLHAPLAVIDECGHFPNIESPERFQTVVIDFVRSLATQ